MVITQSYCYNTEYYFVLLQKPQKQPLEMFCKRSCSWKKFANFKRTKPVSESLFNEVAGLRIYSFIKKRLQHRCFPVKLKKFLRTSILKNICDRMLLKISTLQKNLFIHFFHKIMTFTIIAITFEALKFLLCSCAVFANLFYIIIRASLLC